MDVTTTIHQRRACRSFDHFRITQDLIVDLSHHAQLAPSRFSNQSWQFVFVYDTKTINELYEALSSGNAWAKDASMIIVVHCKKTDDCVIHDRKYFLFDSGLATAFLILRATELGLVVHPIAGFSPTKTREILNIPEDHEVITLVIVGKHASIIKSVLSEKQSRDEQSRPPRYPLTDFISYNRYGHRNHDG
ncbi:MAG: nitroreductase family protein [Candidatus Thermoplasmatota archaeon]|nr:nitroreductase family protein [Candidatus Thermoplasmatota archaeon]MBU1941093.1 nitroreductase family protein [Candidatus Thermoplasmatota archaeon]